MTAINVLRSSSRDYNSTVPSCFFQELVQKNLAFVLALQPALPAVVAVEPAGAPPPVVPTEADITPADEEPVMVAEPPRAGNTGDDLLALLESWRSQIEAMARRLAAKVPYVSISVDDLAQEGLIGAWQAGLRYEGRGKCSLEAFCILRARGAMLTFLKSHKLSTSLEGFLEMDMGDHMMTREIASPPPQHRLASLSVRRRILAALRHLSERERQALLAYYRIEDSRGRVPDREEVCARLGITKKAFIESRFRGLKKLRKILEVAG